MNFRIGKFSVVFLTLCGLILGQLVDSAVFDANGHLFEHGHDYASNETHRLDAVSGESEEITLEHLQEHDLHDMVHSIATVYVQANSDNLDLPSPMNELTITGYVKSLRSISFSPPVPPPLA